MAAATTFPIFSSPDVHNFYVKQKQEFHFNQKSDNDFLMFLLDTAVRVISIVQHLAPVIEAVSENSYDIDEIEDDSPVATPSSNLNNSVSMDTSVPGPLAVELEQINKEITNAQISSQNLNQHSFNRILPSLQTAKSVRNPIQQSVQQPIQKSVQQTVRLPIQQPTQQSIQQPIQQSRQQTVQQPIQHPVQQPIQQSVQHPVQQSVSIPESEPTPTPENELAMDPLPNRTPATMLPNTPALQQPTSAQASESSELTSIPHESQPVAEASPSDEPHPVKSEGAIPEIIEIKEEFTEAAQHESSDSLLSPDTLQQLMSSISATDSGLQNFVPTASPSGLPPSFLDRSAANPLSMLGSMGSGDGPGPSGLNVPNISDSMMKNISDSGLNISNIKGQANPSAPPLQCPMCDFVATKGYPSRLRWLLKRHILGQHNDRRPFSCDICSKTYTRKDVLAKHMNLYHSYS